LTQEALLRLAVYLLYAALVVGFVVVPIGVFWRYRQKRRSQRQRLTALGFVATENDDLLLPLGEHLHGNPWHRPGMSSLRVRTDGDRATYVVDLHYGDSGTPSWWGGVLVTSPRLDLPRFTLLPKIANEPADSSGNRILARWAAPSRKWVALERQPEISSRYVLGAAEPERVERLFDRGCFAWLRAVDGVLASGEGDLLVVWADYLSSVSWLGSPGRSVYDRLEITDRLFDLLAGPRG
jgi:hypothetical protein